MPPRVSLRRQRSVAIGHENPLGAGRISLVEENVQVTERAHPQIAVGGECEQRPLVRKAVDTGVLEQRDDAQEFRRQEEVARHEARSIRRERFHDLDGHVSPLGRAQYSRQRREHSVPLRERDDSAPVERRRQQVVDSDRVHSCGADNQVRLGRAPARVLAAGAREDCRLRHGRSRRGDGSRRTRLPAHPPTTRGHRRHCRSWPRR